MSCSSSDLFYDFVWDVGEGEMAMEMRLRQRMLCATTWSTRLLTTVRSYNVTLFSFMLKTCHSNVFDDIRKDEIINLSAKAFTPRIKLEHAIAFSDAVFAFALTLMALTVDIPDLSPTLTESQLVDRLLEMSSQVESYILSFFIIALFWLSYHQVFNHIRESCISMVYLNLVFLLLITLLSISTSLVITFDTYRISYLVYYSVVVATSSLLVVIWWYAMRIGATDSNIHPLFKRGLLTQLVIVPVVFALSIGVSFVNLDVAQYFWLAVIPLSIYYRLKFRH